MMLGDLADLKLAAGGGRQPLGGRPTRAAALHFGCAAPRTEDDISGIGDEEQAREEADQKTNPEAHVDNVMIPEAADKSAPPPGSPCAPPLEARRCLRQARPGRPG